MNKSGPIIIIDDDVDDQEIFKDVLAELKCENEIICFSTGVLALEYLNASNDQPFIIFSDINMPMMTGIELREKVHNTEKLRLKCIPFIFFTTTANQRHVIEAYSHSVQGFFTKPTAYRDLVRVMGNIIEYWKDCHSPDIQFEEHNGFR